MPLDTMRSPAFDVTKGNGKKGHGDGMTSLHTPTCSASASPCLGARRPGSALQGERVDLPVRE
eukprot:3123566-Pyramimonas_sp.AAC.1